MAESTVRTFRRAFKYRLYPTPKQALALQLLLDASRNLYNVALEQRRNEWAAHKRGLNYYDQAKQLKEARDADERLGLLNYTACQGILRRLQRSFDAFFRRVKKGETPGYPRFKAHDRFDSVEFPAYGDGVSLTKAGNRVRVQNVGDVKVKIHRPVEGRIKTASIKREGDHWYVVLSCDNVLARTYPSTTAEVGIDLGLESFAALSTGEKVENPRWYRRTEARIADAQRAVAAAKANGGLGRAARRRAARLHARAANQRRDFQHKFAHRIVCENNLIAVEDLRPSEMGDLPGHQKSRHDAAWAQFLSILSGKAEEAGRTFVRVPPAGTSSTCNRCGKYRKKELSERVHSCGCGLVLDRDVHASLNILRLGRSLRVG